MIVEMSSIHDQEFEDVNPAETPQRYTTFESEAAQTPHRDARGVSRSRHTTRRTGKPYDVSRPKRKLFSNLDTLHPEAKAFPVVDQEPISNILLAMQNSDLPHMHRADATETSLAEHAANTLPISRLFFDNPVYQEGLEKLSQLISALSSSAAVNDSTMKTVQELFESRSNVAVVKYEEILLYGLGIWWTLSQSKEAPQSTGSQNLEPAPLVKTWGDIITELKKFQTSERYVLYFSFFFSY